MMKTNRWGIRWQKPRVLHFAGLAVLATGLLVRTGSAADPAPSSPGKRSPMERMSLPRLKATHEDVERLKQMRQALPPLPGLHDYRSILHAHAEDSTHTGGTRPEMLADAKKANVSAILLTDHFRPPRDFITESWRGLREGVLFIPGSEAKGFLIYPVDSMMDKMESPKPDFIKTVTAGEGLIFLSHMEERPDHPMDGLNGMEVYNRHADAKKDITSLIALAMKMTEPKQFAELEECVRLYPDEFLAAQIQYPHDYFAKWDAECKTRRLTGVAANDCHHNQVFVVKMVDEETVRVGTIVDKDDQMRKVSASARPGIREMTRNRKPGDVLARLDLDPYYRSFLSQSTHILAPELTEPAIRAALKAGHAYVSHDWMCDPTGFRFEAVPPGPSAAESFGGKSPAAQPRERVLMGDEIKFVSGLKLAAEFPLECKIRLLKEGKVIAEQKASRLDYALEGPGIYRLEGWLTVDGEERGWIYSNPIYVR